MRAYLLAPLLVAVATWLLFLVQTLVAHVEGGHVRPFGVGFLLAVALITTLAGRGPGLLTLLLSLLSLMFILTPLGAGGMMGRPRDWAELVLLLFIGLFLVRGLEALRTNARLLTESEAARARLRAIMDTAPVGVLLSDPAGKLLYANREAERIWGHPLETVGPEDWGRYRIRDPEGNPIPPEKTTLARALAGEPGPVQDERLLEQPDGAKVYVQTAATLVRDGAGKPLNGLVVFSDITERKRVAQQVERLLAREQLINKIGKISQQTLNPDLIQRESVEGLGQLLGVDRCYLRLYEQGSNSTWIGWDWRREGLSSMIGEYAPTEGMAMITSLYQPGKTDVMPEFTRPQSFPSGTRGVRASGYSGRYCRAFV